MRAAVLFVAACCALAFASPARAQDSSARAPEKSPPKAPEPSADAPSDAPAPSAAAGPVVPPAHAPEMPPEHPALLDRSHTQLEAEAGIIVLPAAPISPSNRGGNTPLGTVGNGDATLQTGIHLLYRPDRAWSFGAGAMFAPRPTSDPNFGGASGLPRAHSRSYLTLGGEGRYFPIRSRWVEAWVGVTAGAIIVADRFTTTLPRAVPSILGTGQTTVNTEGFALGGQAGFDYLISERFVVGLAVRADWWTLPSQKPFSQESSCNPIGDCPTLIGSVAAFEFGVTVGYRIPL